MFKSTMLVALVALAGSGVSMADDASCPASAKPAEVSPAPAGWRAWRSDEARELRLADVAFSDGPPEERAFVTPVSSTHRQKSRVDTYDFSSSTFRDIWLICQYHGSTIALVRNTDFRGKRCEVSYKPRGPSEILIAVSCK